MSEDIFLPEMDEWQTNMYLTTQQRPKLRLCLTAPAQTASIALCGDANVETTMIYAHVLNKGGQGVRSPLDRS